MTDLAGTRGGFDFGRVFSYAAGSIGHNAATFAALALLLVGAPTLISTIGMIGVVSQFGPLLNGGPFAGFPHVSSLTGLLVSLGGLIGIVTNAVLQASVIYGTAAYLNGREASFVECLGAGVRGCLPLIGLNIVAAFALVFGFLLFVVPGVMMAVAWVVAAPALIVERTGVFGAFGRSADLTRGHRWSICGLVLIYLVASGVVQQVLNSIMGVTFGAATAEAQMLNQLPVNALIGVIASVLTSTGIAAIYYELRSTREGVGPEALAAVFD